MHVLEGDDRCVDEFSRSSSLADSVAAAVRDAVREEMSVFDARMRRIELMLESVALRAAPAEIGEPPDHGSEDARVGARP